MTVNAQSKLAARYGAADISPLKSWNETINQLLDHRSVRAFTNQLLPDGTIETLVAAAQSCEWERDSVRHPKLASLGTVCKCGKVRRGWVAEPT